MLKRGLMMSLLLFSLTIVIATVPRVVNAVCTASANRLFDEHTGCPFVSKTGHWFVSWSDGYTENLNPEGTGQCNTKWGCCGASPTSVECWPLFNPPTISGTTVSIVVTNRGASSSLVECGTSECMLRDVSCKSLGSTTFSVSHPCGGSGGGGGCGLTFDGGESNPCECFPESPDCVSPIVIDVAGNGFQLSSAAAGVDFDIRANGAAERISWTTQSSDDGWLALDRNGNGTIDDGSELFGNFTPQPSPPVGQQKHGFLALAEYDKPTNGGNADGLITLSDGIFASLRLWQDRNHNGISEAAELISLQAAGLNGIETDYKQSMKYDEYGNYFRYRAKVKDDQGAQVNRWAWDVFLVTR